MRVIPRVIASSLPIALVASGCVGGAHVGQVSIVSSAQGNHAAGLTTIVTHTGTNNLAAQSPVPSVSVPPDPPALLAQPVALNPMGGTGFSDATANYLALSIATAQPPSQVDLSVASLLPTSASTDPGAGVDIPFVSTGSGVTPPSTGTASASPGSNVVSLDPQAPFQTWVQGQVARYRPSPPPSGFRTQALAPPHQVGDVVPFYVITSFNAASYADVQIKARVGVVGQHCYVMIDQAIDANPSDAAIINQRAMEIADTFDKTIYPTDTRIFGSEPDPGVDNDSHIYILLSPAVSNNGRENTLGFFCQRDEFAPFAGAPPIFAHSNAKEMLYISSTIVETGASEDYLGTIAHEFQHMINFNQKVLVGKNQQSEDLWIDEGMAMYAIEACGYGLKTGGQVLGNHVKRYEERPAAYSLTDWANNPEGIGYGPVYLFMVYLADHFGEAIIHQIVDSPKEGIANINEVLARYGTSFNAVFHDWALANLLDGRPQNTDARYQYKSLKMLGSTGQTTLAGITPQPLTIPADQSLTLRPYIAIYYQMPEGAQSPRFSFTPTAESGTQPRLVLP